MYTELKTIRFYLLLVQEESANEKTCFVDILFYELGNIFFVKYSETCIEQTPSGNAVVSA